MKSTHGIHLFSVWMIPVILLVWNPIRAQDNRLYSIPQQTLNLYQLMGDSSQKPEQVIANLHISGLVTFREYKAYLDAVKKDSSAAFYKTQWPDSAMCPKTVYQSYINSPVYDDYPVVGVSWKNALNFCRWKTLRENKKDSLEFIYRLPSCSEWLAAFYYLEKTQVKHDLNKYYSDWTLNVFDEASYDFSNKAEVFRYDYFFFPRPQDQRVLTRMRILGNSFLHQHKPLYPGFYNYADQGQRDLGFRCVKDIRIHLPPGHKTLAENLLNYWKIAP